jgi:hypothetical protein
MCIQWVYNGSTMCIQWVYNRSTMCIQWVFNVSTMELQWVYNCYTTWRSGGAANCETESGQLRHGVWTSNARQPHASANAQRGSIGNQRNTSRRVSTPGKQTNEAEQAGRQIGRQKQQPAALIIQLFVFVVRQRTQHQCLTLRMLVQTIHPMTHHLDTSSMVVWLVLLETNQCPHVALIRIQQDKAHPLPRTRHQWPDLHQLSRQMLHEGLLPAPAATQY